MRQGPWFPFANSAACWGVTRMPHSPWSYFFLLPLPFALIPILTFASLWLVMIEFANGLWAYFLRCVVPSPAQLGIKSWNRDERVMKRETYIIWQAGRQGVLLLSMAGRQNGSFQPTFLLAEVTWDHSVHLLRHARLLATPWTAARQASLSITNSWSLLKHMSIVCHPTISSSVFTFFSCLQSFPASGSFQMSQLFTLGGHSIVVSASASVLPMNIQDWFPLGWTGWTSLQSEGLPRVFSNTTVQKHQFFGSQFSL